MKKRAVGEKINKNTLLIIIAIVVLLVVVVFSVPKIIKNAYRDEALEGELKTLGGGDTTTLLCGSSAYIDPITQTCCKGLDAKGSDAYIICDGCQECVKTVRPPKCVGNLIPDPENLGNCVIELLALKCNPRCNYCTQRCVQYPTGGWGCVPSGMAMCGNVCIPESNNACEVCSPPCTGACKECTNGVCGVLSGYEICPDGTCSPVGKCLTNPGCSPPCKPCEETCSKSSTTGKWSCVGTRKKLCPDDKTCIYDYETCRACIRPCKTCEECINGGCAVRSGYEICPDGTCSPVGKCLTNKCPRICDSCTETCDRVLSAAGSPYECVSNGRHWCNIDGKMLCLPVGLRCCTVNGKELCSRI